MTKLRRRFIEDMQLRGLAPTTQRSYLHYVVEYARFYNTSPEHLDLEAVRHYQLYLSQERGHSLQSINTFVSAVQFLYRGDSPGRFQSSARGPLAYLPSAGATA